MQIQDDDSALFPSQVERIMKKSACKFNTKSNDQVITKPSRDDLNKVIGLCTCLNRHSVNHLIFQSASHA